MSIFKLKATAAQGVEVPPAGSFPAVMVAVIDLGTHTEEFTDDKTKERKQKDFRKILLAWELPGERVAGTTRNHVVCRDYNLSFLSTSALRKLVEKWRGKTIPDNEFFDVTVLLGKPCLLTLVHGESARGNKYAKIDGVTAMPKGLPVPAATIKPVLWEFGEGECPDLSWLPYLYGEPVKDVIASSHEAKGTGPGVVPAATPQLSVVPAADDDSIPF